jgi:SAM-dependent methyltransferase
MSNRCTVCLTPLTKPIYASAEPISVTSLCEVRPGVTEVFFCRHCSHLQTPELAQVSAYYDTEYQILIDSDDEDQLYLLDDGRKRYRSEHQADVLQDKVTLPNAARILDYGCAKAATLKHLLARRPDLVPHVFDVSSMYESFWAGFVPKDNWATYDVKPAWAGTFDLVTSFYSLEHMVDPRAAVATIARLLVPGGVFYGIVPDWTTNVADVVVVDHVNHFSQESLRFLLESHGFVDITCDGSAHQGALVWTARRGDAPHPAVAEDVVAALAQEAEKVAAYWRDFATTVRAFEAQHPGASAIYGSGFYGTFLTTCLRDPAAVTCYLDQNPHRQGKTLLDRPVVAPDALPPAIAVVYVGLNPAHARREIAKVDAWQSRDLTYFYP